MSDVQAVRLDGPVLWRCRPGADPAWVSGAWIVQGRLTRERPTTCTRTVSGWAVPGLVDVHCHLGYTPDGIASEADTRAAARTVAAGGVLLVRDAGIPEAANACLIGEPAGPELIRCGRHIARPKRYIRGLAVELDGPDQLAAEVARQAARSDGWVKIVADWIDRSGGREADLAPLWTPEQLRAAVAAAHALGARVTAHTFSHAALDALLDARIDCLEHGTGLDAAQAARCRESGIPVTPTLAQVELFADFARAAGDKYPVYAAHMDRMWRERERHFQLLLSAGVTLLPGTDSGGYQPFGSLPGELARWQRWGADPADILAWATWRARDYLGRSVLSEGAPADVVVYPTSPEVDAGVYASPCAVFRAGRPLRTGSV